MEKQTVRITLRMSERLHDLLTQAADDRPLNTEIVRRLESTFSGALKSELSENINDLGGRGWLTAAQREEVLELIRNELGRQK